MSIDDRPPLVDEPPYPDPYEPYDPTYDTGGPTEPPHRGLDAEQSVLGAMIANPTVIPDVTSTLNPSDYANPRHEQIHDAILALHAADQPVDMVTVTAELLRRGDLQRIGGAPYLHSLVAGVTITTNAAYHAAIVRDQARLRSIEHVATKLRQIANEGSIDNIHGALLNGIDTLDEAFQRDAPNRTTTHTTWAPVDLAPVLAGEHLDPPPTILAREDGVFLFYDSAVHTVAGESESGKTWLTLLAAKQLLEQDERVVFLDFEDRADRVVGRLLSLGATIPQIQQHFAYIRPDRPLDDDGRTQLQPALTGARLVIVDGVTEAMTMHGYDLNSNADSALFQGLIPRWIADHGPAVVMIDHVVKDKEKQDRFALGAQHKLAGIDGAAYLVKVLQPFARGKSGLARIEISKDRPGHVREHAHGKTIAEFTLDANHDGLINTAHLMPPGAKTGRAGDTFEPTVLMEKISRYVQANPGMSKKAIEGAMNGKATTIRLGLELLVTRGYIGVKTGQRGAVQHFHIRPYYADPEADIDGGHRPWETLTGDASDGPSDPETEGPE